MTNTGILIIAIGLILITIIICTTVFIMSWYDNWRRSYIETLKKFVNVQYKIYKDRPETVFMSTGEFNKIIEEIKDITNRL